MANDDWGDYDMEPQGESLFDSSFEQIDNLDGDLGGYSMEPDDDLALDDPAAAFLATQMEVAEEHIIRASVRAERQTVSGDPTRLAEDLSNLDYKAVYPKNGGKRVWQAQGLFGTPVVEAPVSRATLAQEAMGKYNMTSKYPKGSEGRRAQERALGIIRGEATTHAESIDESAAIHRDAATAGNLTGALEASQLALKEQQISQQPAEVRQAIKDAIGGSLIGQAHGKDQLDNMTALERLTRTIGTDPSRLAIHVKEHELPSAVVNINPDTMSAYGVPKDVTGLGGTGDSTGNEPERVVQPDGSVHWMAHGMRVMAPVTNTSIAGVFNFGGGDFEPGSPMSKRPETWVGDGFDTGLSKLSMGELETPYTAAPEAAHASVTGSGPTITVKRKRRAPLSLEMTNRAFGQMERSDDYLQQGPGGKLKLSVVPDDVTGAMGPNIPAGTEEHNAERRLREQTRLDEEMVEANRLLPLIADHYIHARTKSDNPDYEYRKSSVATDITKYMLDGTHHIESGHVLPTPNEIPTMGLVPTANFANRMGTPHTRLQWGMIRDQFTEGTDEYNKQAPNLMGSLVPIDWNAFPNDHEAARADQKDRFDKLQEQARFVQRVYHEQMTTLQDEDYGNDTRRVGYYKKPVNHSQDVIGSAAEINTWDEAMNLGLDLSGESAAINSGVSTRKVGTTASSFGRSGNVSTSNLGFEGFVGPPTEYGAGSAEIRNKYNVLRSGFGALEHNIAARESFKSSSILTASNLDGSEVGGPGGQENRPGQHGEVAESEYHRYNAARIAGLDEDTSLSIARGMDSIENALEHQGFGELTGNETDRELYQRKVAGRQAPKQRTPGWYRQRQGKATASAFTNAKGDVRGKFKLAANIAKDQKGAALGLEQDHGSAYSAAGTAAEPMVLASFLRREGVDMDYEEAYFETHPELGEIGASADGRLFDKKTGKSQGLLELKYLTTDNVPKARAKYMDQMQVQMAVTGETQTHFYVYDQYTNQANYELIHADPEMQDALLAKGVWAVSQQDSLNTVEDISVMRERGRFSGRTPSASTASAGQEARFDNSDAAEPSMTAFDPNTMHGPSTPQMVQDRIMARVAAARGATANSQGTGGTSGDDVNPSPYLGGPDSGRMTSSGATDREWTNAIKMNTKATQDATRAERDAMREREQQEAAAANHSSKMVEGFVKGFGDVAKMIMSGNDSAMGDVRLGAEAGVSEGTAHGMRLNMMSGGMTESAAVKTTQTLGDWAAQMSSGDGYAKGFTHLSAIRGKSLLPEVQALKIPSGAAAQGMSALDWGTWATSAAAGMNDTRARKVLMDQMLGVKELGAFDQEQAYMPFADSYQAIDVAAARSANQGINEADRDERLLYEKMQADEQAGASLGYVAQIHKSSAKYGFSSNKVAQGLLSAASVGVVSGSFINDAINDFTGLGNYRGLSNTQPEEPGFFSGIFDGFHKGDRWQAKEAKKLENMQTINPNKSLTDVINGNVADGVPQLTVPVQIDVQIDGNGVKTTAEVQGNITEEVDTENLFP